MAGGLIWGMLAGYARRLVADPLKGRALAIAGVARPSPCRWACRWSTLLGDALGWRSAFGAISLLTLAVMAWILAKVPDFAGQPAGKRQGVGLVLRSPACARCWPCWCCGCWRTAFSTPMSRPCSARPACRDRRIGCC